MYSVSLRFVGPQAASNVASSTQAVNPVVLVTLHFHTLERPLPRRVRRRADRGHGARVPPEAFHAGRKVPPTPQSCYMTRPLRLLAAVVSALSMVVACGLAGSAVRAKTWRCTGV